MNEQLTTAQMAVRVGISERSIQRWIQEGRLSATRIEDSALYEVESSDLERLRLRGHREEESRLQAVERAVNEMAERLSRVEREIEYEDDISDRIDALTEQFSTLDRQIQELRQMTLERIEKGKKPLAVSTATTEERNATRATTAPNKAIVAQDDSQKTEELPDSLVSASSFAKQHGIPESTINKAIDTHRIPVVEGTWKAGRATVKKALNQAGRQRFYELYSHNERFTPCDACPHTPL